MALEIKKMKHKMNLEPASFESIKNKTKTIEMRLNDEKRSKIQLNEMIEFVNVKTNESLLVKVINLYRYPFFFELYLHHEKQSIGYLENETPNYDDMLNYYAKEQIEKYGVLAIEIQVMK